MIPIFLLSQKLPGMSGLFNGLCKATANRSSMAITRWRTTSTGDNHGLNEEAKKQQERGR